MKRILILLAVAFSAVNCEEIPVNPQNEDNPGIDKTTPSAWTIIGTIGGSKWDKDILMYDNYEYWCVAPSVTIADGEQFKFRKDKGWDTNLGYGKYVDGSANTVIAGEKLALSNGAGNMKIAAGKYDIYLAPDPAVAYILPAGEEFTHAEEGYLDNGGDLEGDYSNLDPAAKQSGITYQLNVYSFADSDGDGWGDFQGIIDHLDYLDAIGATSLWLSPVHASQSYHAYDIKDYFSINPIYGGKGATSAQAEEKFRDLIAKAKEKNIAIYMDYVLNHSGDQCEWFQKAKSGDAKYRGYYVFSDDPASDQKNGKVDNFAGQTDYHMGAWHKISSGNAGYNGLLHFELDVTSASAPKLTITQGSGSSQSSNTDTSVGWFIYDNNAQRMYKKADNVYEITLSVNNNWGVLVKDHATEWGDHKWGAKSGDQSVQFGTPKTLVKGSAANDIIFSSDYTSYFASFDGSMPDLNYGPYTTCSESDAFKELTASADKWIKMGVGGFRLDAVMWIYQCHEEANTTFLSAWYDHCNATYKANGGEGDFFMVGEAWDYDASKMAPYYKGLPCCFDFPYYGTLRDRINSGKGSDFAEVISGFISKYNNAYGNRKYSHSSGMYEAPKLSNHDEDRVASLLGKNPQKIRLAGAVLLTSPGNPFIYQGEELGYWGVKQNGDENVRQPVYWKKNGSVPDKWCNFNKEILTTGMSVEEQAADERSLLNLYRHFAYARNTNPALAKGKMEPTPSNNGAVAAWYMTSTDQKVLVMHNFSNSAATVTRGSDNLSKIIVSNQEITVNGSSVTIPAYGSVVFEQ